LANSFIHGSNLRVNKKAGKSAGKSENGNYSRSGGFMTKI